MSYVKNSEQEQNNTIFSANLSGIGLPGPIYGVSLFSGLVLPGDTDSFSVFGFAGSTIKARVFGAFDTQIYLYSDLGLFINFNNDFDGIGSYLQYTLPVTGIYVFQICAEAPGQAGHYTLGLAVDSLAISPTDISDNLNAISSGNAANFLVGGAGSDSLWGDSGNDVLEGGTGNDVVHGGNGLDLALFDLPRAAAIVAKAGGAGTWSITSPLGRDTLISVEQLQFGDYAVSQATKQQFYGDGFADLLWQAKDGSVIVWNTDDNSRVSAATVANPSTFWKVAPAGDFDGDGRSDILLRGADGTIATWKMAGAVVLGSDLVRGVDGNILNPGNFWTVLGTADFHRDGRADILWQGADGSVAIWNMLGATGVGAGVVANPGSFWSFSGTGDFNGDGRADILWRGADGSASVWLMNGSTGIGGGVITDGVAAVNPGNFWSIAGVGDFYGDGRADILWRGNDGSLIIWNMNGSAIAGGSGAPISRDLLGCPQHRRLRWRRKI